MYFSRSVAFDGYRTTICDFNTFTFYRSIDRLGAIADNTRVVNDTMDWIVLSDRAQQKPC